MPRKRLAFCFVECSFLQFSVGKRTKHVSLHAIYNKSMPRTGLALFVERHLGAAKQEFLWGKREFSREPELKHPEHMLCYCEFAQWLKAGWRFTNPMVCYVQYAQSAPRKKFELQRESAKSPANGKGSLVCVAERTFFIIQLKK